MTEEAFKRKHEAHVEAALALLPTWFVARMMQDSWHFGLALSTGEMLVIETIRSVSQAADGSIWLSVYLHTDAPYGPVGKHPLITAPTSRTEASVNAAHILYAIELADT